MKKKYFINANIIDPYNSLNETGGLIIDENGKIEGVGKKVNTNKPIFQALCFPIVFDNQSQKGMPKRLAT